MGWNFDDYPGFQPMRSLASTYAHDCSRLKILFKRHIIHLNIHTNGSVEGLERDSSSQKKYDFSPKTPSNFTYPLCWVTLASHNLPSLTIFVGWAGPFWKMFVWVVKFSTPTLPRVSRSTKSWPVTPKKYKNASFNKIS